MSSDFDEDIGRTPQVDAPALAKLQSLIDGRPSFLCDQPFVADADLFEKARTEMTEVQQRLGWPLAVAPWIKQPNFMLRGTVVVSDDV